MQSISVIIICANGRKVTNECLRGVKKLPVKEIIVVDNASTDGTAQLLDKLAQTDQRFKIIHNSMNNGFAEANNQGFKISTGRYVLFLNNDTIVEKNFLTPLLKTIQDYKVAAVQPMILFPDGTIDSIGSFLTPTGFLYHKAHRMKPKQKFLQLEAVYSLKGACMLWKRRALQRIGLFDESYFAYFEETDLCHRAINHGYEVLCDPSSSIIHLGGFTSNSMNQEFIQYHNTKNRIMTYLVHFPFSKVISILFLHLVLTQALILKNVLGHRFSLALKMEKGLLQGAIIGTKRRFLSTDDFKSFLNDVLRKPDLGYYKALFSSLQGYTKIW